MAFASRCAPPFSSDTGTSSTDNRMRQAMSTPTAYGITASSVASTPPIGSPYPGWASGIRAPRTDTGSRAASRICPSAAGAMSSPQRRHGAGASRSWNPVGRSGATASASSPSSGSSRNAAGSAASARIRPRTSGVPFPAASARSAIPTAGPSGMPALIRSRAFTSRG